MRGLLKRMGLVFGALLVAAAACSDTTGSSPLQIPDEVLAVTASTTHGRYWWTRETIKDPDVQVQHYDEAFRFRLVRYGSDIQTVAGGIGVCPSVRITYATNDPKEDPDHRGRLCSYVEKVGSWYNIYYEFTLYFRPNGIGTAPEQEVEKGRLLARERTKCTKLPCHPKQPVEVLDPSGLEGVFAGGGLVEALLNTPNSSLVEDGNGGYLLYVWLGGRLFWTERIGDGGTDPDPKCTPGMARRGFC